MNFIDRQDILSFQSFKTEVLPRIRWENASAIYDMHGLYNKQWRLPNPWIMDGIIGRMESIRAALGGEIDPIEWLAWQYFGQEKSCAAISKELKWKNIDYKVWSISQFFSKQLNWNARAHTHITPNGRRALAQVADNKSRVSGVFQKNHNL